MTGGSVVASDIGSDIGSVIGSVMGSVSGVVGSVLAGGFVPQAAQKSSERKSRTERNGYISFMAYSIVRKDEHKIIIIILP